MFLIEMGGNYYIDSIHGGGLGRGVISVSEDGESRMSVSYVTHESDLSWPRTKYNSVWGKTGKEEAGKGKGKGGEKEERSAGGTCRR